MKQILLISLMFLMFSCGGQAAYRSYIMVEKDSEGPIKEQVDNNIKTDPTVDQGDFTN